MQIIIVHASKQAVRNADDAGINMRYASKVIIAPGYGLAVAQAQHKLYES